MNNSFKLGAAWILLAIAGCASTLQEPQYYLLSDPDTTAAASSCEVDVVSLTLAPYLQKANIVVQTQGNVLVPAVYHRWSEPLEASSNSVVQSCLGLGSDGGGQASSAEALVEESEPRQQLSIHLRHFHGDTNGRVVLQGHWETGSHSGTFSRDAQQADDGYDALVTSHRDLLLQLCANIRGQLPSCQ